MQIHQSIHITGKVQGVSFRSSTRIMADSLGITGFVRNESDGSVYIEAEGEPEKLKEFTAWCHHGPTFAQVDQVTVKTGKNLQHFQSFVEE